MNSSPTAVAGSTRRSGVILIKITQWRPQPTSTSAAMGWLTSSRSESVLGGMASGSIFHMKHDVHRVWLQRQWEETEKCDCRQVWWPSRRHAWDVGRSRLSPAFHSYEVARFLWRVPHARLLAHCIDAVAVWNWCNFAFCHTYEDQFDLCFLKIDTQSENLSFFFRKSMNNLIIYENLWISVRISVNMWTSVKIWQNMWNI